MAFKKIVPTPKYFYTISLIFLLVCIPSSKQVDTMDKMKAVKDKILENYDKSIRPSDGVNATLITLTFMPEQIIDFDEEKGILTFNARLQIQWQDDRLQWNSTDYNGELQIKQELLWLPDISVFNSHSAHMDPTHESLPFVRNSGSVAWVTPILTLTTCSALEQTSYPYDENLCAIDLGSWSHDGWEIDYYHTRELDYSCLVNSHSRWELITNKSYAERHEIYYECCKEPYVSIQINLELKRRPVPEIEATRAPCILVMILTLVIFWLPADSSKKIMLGGILFLTLNVLFIYVAGKTRNPLAILYGVSFIQTAMYIVTISLLLQVFVVIRIASLTGPSRPPAFIMSRLTGTLGKYLVLQSSLREDRMSLESMQQKDEPLVKVSQSVMEEWKMFATVLDRALFVIMIIVMIAVHHI